MIPKIIHYCWLSNDSFPENIKKYMNSWTEKLQNYEFILWDLDRFDINTSMWVRQAFEAKKYAFAADYIRLYAVYHYGGIYLDMDIEVIKPFDDLLQNSIILAHEDDKLKYIEAGCFGAEKEHPLIKIWLDYFSNKNFTLKMIENGYTLPKMMAAIYAQHLEFNWIKFYHSSFFTAKNLATGLITITNNTYCIHHFSGSWLSFSQKKYLKMKRQIANSHFPEIIKQFLYFFIGLKNKM